MDPNVTNLFHTALGAYLAQCDNTLEPSGTFLPYEFKFIQGRRWHIEGGEMVEGELREVTNQINHWHSDLRKWHAWNNVIAEYEGDDAWRLRREFLEARVHQCLLWPSAIRDTFTFIATNSFHQVRLSSTTDYKDYMEGDLKHPDQKPSHLTRKKKEKRLSNIVSIWPNSIKFLESLRAINDRDYQHETSDYRNRASHAIAPRQGLGIVQTVVRTVVPATNLEEQPNGAYMEVPVPGKVKVSYGFGGIQPLDLERGRVSNLQQYLLARECYRNYIQLLQLGIEAIEPYTQNA